MNGEVRVGRKEAKRSRTAREQQTHDHHKASSRGRATVVSDFTEFTRLFEKAGLPEADELPALIDRMITEHREGTGDPADHGPLIFDPDRIDLSTLPIGVLDHKELPLPVELLPRSRDDLQALCERLIVRSRNRELIAYVVAGWPGCTASRHDIHDGKVGAIDEAMSYLQRHVGRLWHLSAAAPGIYRFIVAGQHGRALKLLRDNGPPKNFTVPVILELIAHQGLIWCCNDLQLILARGRAAATNPFGMLVSTSQVELKPERIANDLRPHLLLLRLALQLYATWREEHHPDRPKPLPVTLPEGDHARMLGKAVDRDLGSLVAELARDRSPLDQLVEQMRSLPTNGYRRLWRILDKPVTANQLSAHFSGIWFSRLSHVQVAGVAILRYLQAETAIMQLVRERHPTLGSGSPAARNGTAMPPFDQHAIDAQWRIHAKDLLFLYRREALRDKMAPTADAALTQRSKNASDAVIDVALKFLKGRPQRQISDHDRQVESAERTFYLIDVIPETRLAR